MKKRGQCGDAQRWWLEKISKADGLSYGRNKSNAVIGELVGLGLVELKLLPSMYRNYKRKFILTALGITALNTSEN